MQCVVAIELKINNFKFEYLGKMELYLAALDRDVKKLMRIQVFVLFSVRIRTRM